MNITNLGELSTVDELIKILSKYDKSTTIGFRNQPMQDLYEIKRDNEVFLCFQPKKLKEIEELNKIDKK